MAILKITGLKGIYQAVELKIKLSFLYYLASTIKCTGGRGVAEYSPNTEGQGISPPPPRVDKFSPVTVNIRCGAGWGGGLSNSHRYRPLAFTWPAQLQIYLYVRTSGPPGTVSSPILGALHTSLKLISF
jgi:hypothetical protein